MNKVIILIVAILIIGGGIYVFTKDDSRVSDSMEQSSVIETGNNSEENKPVTNELDPNNYTKGAEIGETLDATGQTDVNVTINDNIFDTTYLKIKRGTKVTWTNEGTARHDVTSASSSPKKGLSSELLNNGESYSFTFDATGLYEYFCTPHALQMKAVVTVVD